MVIFCFNFNFSRRLVGDLGIKLVEEFVGEIGVCVCACVSYLYVFRSFSFYGYREWVVCLCLLGSFVVFI